MSFNKIIRVDPLSNVTLAQQIKEQIAWLIACGKLQPGNTLPPIRQLASQLSINLHTVRSAYQKLEAEGLVISRRGSGTLVLPYEPGDFTPQPGVQRSDTIGVILPSLANPFYHGFLEGVEAVTALDRKLLFLCHTHDQPEIARRYFGQLAAKQVDGVLVVSHDLSHILSLQSYQPIPVVSVDWPGALGYSVEMNLENAAFQATTHLIQHGHRRVGLITAPIAYANVQPLYSGYLRALQESSLRMDQQMIAQVVNFDIPAGEAGAEALLSLENPPTAIFAIADLLAIGALRFLHSRGLRVPQDLALASFNNIPLAALIEPPLTTVNAPARQLGSQAMSLLNQLISGMQPVKQRVVLSTSLVVRQSCGCI